MPWTTRIKLFLKKYLPFPIFFVVRFLADVTLLKIIPLFFKYKISSFKKRMVKKVFYNGKNFNIVIDPKNGYLDAQIYANGLYEPHIVKEIINNTPKGGVCFDVGANIGHHSIVMSQCVQNNGKVFAFEPIPHIREQMKESLTLNEINNVEIISDALSNKEGELNLHLRDGNIGGSSLVDVGDSKTIKVNVKTLDSYNYRKVDFIKIDVEGFEYNVLLGGEKTIEKYQPVILFEYSPIYYRRYEPSHTKNILSFFEEHNYKLFDLEDKRKEITDISFYVKDFENGLRSQTNILATPK